MPTSGSFRPEQNLPLVDTRPLEPMPDLPRPSESHSEQPIEQAQTRESAMRSEPKLTQETEGLLSRIRKPKTPPTTKPFVRDELTLEVEHIMSEGMLEAFKSLPPVKQQEFKMKGEETAREIRTMLFSTKVKVKKIFELILDWLKILPGINKFFLEQEAKIKAERIVRLKELRNFKP